MTVIKKRFASRLAPMIGTREGLTIEQATAAAEANLISIRDECLASLDEALAVVFAHVPGLISRPSKAGAETVYQAASQVLSLAGLCQLEALGQAAFSLCDLIDTSGTRGRWNSAALDAHLNALRILRNPEAVADQHALAQMLMGLKLVVVAVSR